MIGVVIIRIMSALVGVGILLIVIMSEKLVILYAIIAVSIAMLYEFFGAFGFFKRKETVVLSGISFLIPVAASLVNAELFPMIISIYGTTTFFALVFLHKKVNLDDVSKLFCVTFITTLFMSTIVQLRQGEYGVFLVCTALIGGWVTDTGAYFCGKFFGKHLLCPAISPNKTVEGAIGGWITAFIAYMVYGVMLVHVIDVEVNFLNLAVLGITAPVFAQIGDLSASAIKREYNIKDFGYIMPGHGGVLDRFDSILFVTPFVYYFLEYFPIL